MIKRNSITSVIIVLGQTLYKDENDNINMLPSNESRVELAYDIYHDHNLNKNNTRIILSGGDTKNYNITEAEIMKKKLISLHEQYSDDSIDDIMILEVKGSNTIEKALNVYDIISSNDNYDNCTIYIISNNYHIPRVRIIFKKVFNKDPSRSYKLIYHSADYRLKSKEKCKDIENNNENDNQDLYCMLSELLSLEENSLETLNNDLDKYKLQCSKSDTNKALKELRKIKESIDKNKNT